MTENKLQKEYFNKIVCSPYNCFYVFLIYLHLFIVIVTISYPLLVRDNNYDFHYIIFLYLLMFQWILFKNECIINYIEKIKMDPDYKLGTNIDSPGLNYILSKFNITIYNQSQNETYIQDKHNLLVPFLLLLIFSYIVIRYFPDTKTKIIHILIYSLLTYILMFKVSYYSSLG